MSDPARDALAGDRAARAIAQREFVSPIVLEAGAGTGKTTTLVARVLAWALADGWHLASEASQEDNAEIDVDKTAATVLEGIVSITFTEAAAAEMEARIAAALSRVASGPASDIVGFHPPEVEGGEPTLALRAQALLAALDHLTVRTIHAYCLHLLKRYPLEARLHPDLAVDADGQVLEELVSEVVESGLREAYTSTAEGPLVHLARVGIGPRRIAEALKALAERGVSAEHLRADPFGPERATQLLTRLRQPLEALDRLLAGRFDGLPAKQNAPKIAEATRLSLRALERADEEVDAGIEAVVAVCSTMRSLWTSKLVDAHLGKWKRGAFTKAESKALDDDSDRLSEAGAELRGVLRQFRRLDPRLVDQARRALTGLLGRIEEEMRSRGIITFSGLLSAARDLLANEAPVRRRERRRLRQLLVDEFQDTDRLQCDLVRLLALSGRSDRRPGLFVVGDPKQSIYGWRNADLEAYEAFVRAATAAGGERFSLVVNFRSVAPVLSEVDRVITPVMRREDGLQPEYERLLPSDQLAEASGFERAGRAAVEYWASWSPDEDGGESTSSDVAAQLEAEGVARDILELCRAGEAEWSDFAVLLRSGYQLDNFLNAFRDAGVPFAVARDKSYFRRREIIEASALIRTIVNPVDHLALLTFLRSPIAGVPDAAILPLWREELPDLLSSQDRPSKELLSKLRRLVRQVASELPEDIPGITAIKGWERSLLHALDALLRLRASFATDPADRFIENIRSWLLLEASESARYLGSFRVANLERFLRQLESALERSGGDIQVVLRALRRGVAEAQEAEEAVPKEAALDAVQILTIHAAKGLEFRHVYLAQLHAGSRDSDNQLVDHDERWAPGDPLEYRLFGSPTPDFDQVLERRAEVERAERVRLLYVAMTRARERLVLLGRWADRPRPKELDRCGTFLDLLASRELLPESIADLIDESDGQPTRLGGALWRFPALESRSTTPRETEEAPTWLPRPEAVRAAAERLKVLSRQALAHMERPYHQAASREAAERLEAQALESATRSASASRSRETAMQVGTAVHRLFETWEFDNDEATEFQRQTTRARHYLRQALGDASVAEALERLSDMLKRIERGSLFRRFLELEGRVVARELPVVLPPASGDEGPVGFRSGAVDLLYRTEDGELVIVDFKTDALELEIEIEARAADYTPQEDAYAEAVRSALALDQAPSTELWFLWPDRLHRRRAAPSG